MFRSAFQSAFQPAFRPAFNEKSGGGGFSGPVYLRLDGVSFYNRSDGTSIYKRPTT